jgi:hypothetical protein
MALIAVPSLVHAAEGEPRQTLWVAAEPPPIAMAPVRFEHRPISVVGVAGFGAPLGLVGIAGQYALAEALSLGAGAGTNSQGLQLSVFANLRPLHWSARSVAIAVGPQVAYATGPWDPLEIYATGHGSNDGQYVFDRAHWLQVDLGLEVQSKGGFVFRFSHGAAFLLNPNGGHCEGAASCPMNTEKVLFTMAMTLGYAFGGE